MFPDSVLVPWPGCSSVRLGDGHHHRRLGYSAGVVQRWFGGSGVIVPTFFGIIDLPLGVERLVGSGWAGYSISHLRVFSLAAAILVWWRLPKGGEGR